MFLLLSMAFEEADNSEEWTIVLTAMPVLLSIVGKV